MCLRLVVMTESLNYENFELVIGAESQIARRTSASANTHARTSASAKILVSECKNYFQSLKFASCHKLARDNANIYKHLPIGTST